MIRMLQAWTPANRAALGVLIASALLFASAATGARRIAEPPRQPAPRAAAAMPRVPARGAEAGDDGQILRTVARDPFRPDRRRPPGRYRMPGAEPPPPEAQPAYDFRPITPVPVFSLVGTVILGDGRGLAALAGQNGESRIVRVGEEMDGFRVVRVTSGTATLSNGDTTLVLKTEGGAP